MYDCKKRVWSFGKVDYTRCGRKINEVCLEVTLYSNRNGYPEFTVSGKVWNMHHTDIITGGQCVDTILLECPSLENDKIYKAIFRLWKNYHLKDVSNINETDKKLIDMLTDRNVSRINILEFLAKDVDKVC